MSVDHQPTELEEPTRTQVGAAELRRAHARRLGLDPLGVGGPQRLDLYVLLGQIGRGGMGVVYAAYDERLNRKVAIKLLHGQASDSAQRRLRREALALAQLAHPNVVRVYEIGELDEQTYLVMEYVEGQTLRAWLGARPRRWREIVEVLLAAGRGLAAAHAKDLMHRDFKPDNVMLDDEGRVLVMDFGLARASDEDSPTAETVSASEDSAAELRASLTVAGSIMGTPAYMAPEQLRGATIDARADQFSFCVTLWEALFGRRPFLAADLDELVERVEAGRIEPAERGDVPGWLRKVLRRGLALAGLGKLDEALAVQRRGLEIRIAAFGPHHPDVATAHHSLSLTLGLLGDHAGGLEHHHLALRIRTAEFGPDHLAVADVLYGAVELLLALGQREQALADARRALAIREAALAPDHPQVVEARTLVERLRGDGVQPLHPRADPP